MRRVLQVVGKMNVGGAEQLLMNVYRNIDKSKIQFDFLTFYDEGEQGYFDQEIIALGGRIINIRKPSELTFFRNVKEVEDVLRQERYDAIHTHIGENCAYAIWGAKKTGIPIRIVHSHNSSRRNRSFFSYLYGNILKYISNIYLTKCCACSEKAGEFRFSKKNMKKKYFYMPNAINFADYLKDYDKNQIRSNEGITEDELMILQVGNFQQQKNQKFTIEVLRTMVEANIKCKVVFAGRGSKYGEKVKSKIQQYQLQDNVRFLGQRTDIPELMAAADVLIMPSIREGLGIVLLEAQASGLPCVVSESIQPEANLNGGLLQVCSLKDVESWKDCILEASKKPRLSQRERMTMIEKSSFRLEDTIDCFMKLYEV